MYYFKNKHSGINYAVGLLMVIICLLAMPNLILADGTDEPQFNKYSYYRFMMGGSWVHTDNGPTDGKFTAAMLVRTRIGSWEYGPLKWHSIDDDSDPDQFPFIDLFVDAQFITNTPFYRVFNADFTGGLTADSVLLT
ncbi:MAG: hypothetical protein ABIJ45_01605, partial [Candidatus Zixiibacteriota bacterium]